MKAKEFINEGGGYIPQNEEEAHDPRFMMAITCDIHPGQDRKEAAKFGFDIDENGNPPFLRSNGKITESADKYSKKTDFRFKDGAMLMQRFGSINAKKQDFKTSHRPPVSRGIWAFPYPAFDMFFAYHKIEPSLPADLRHAYITSMFDKMDKATDEDEKVRYQDLIDSLWAEREVAIKKIEHKIKPTTFWWRGPIYSHIGPNGQQGQEWYLWTDIKAFAKAANKSIVFGGSKDFGSSFSPERGFMMYSVDHLEVFLPEKAELTKKYIKSKKPKY